MVLGACTAPPPLVDWFHMTVAGGALAGTYNYNSPPTTASSLLPDGNSLIRIDVTFAQGNDINNLVVATDDEFGYGPWYPDIQTTGIQGTFNVATLPFRFTLTRGTIGGPVTICSSHGFSPVAVPGPEGFAYPPSGATGTIIIDTPAVTAPNPAPPPTPPNHPIEVVYTMTCGAETFSGTINVS